MANDNLDLNWFDSVNDDALYIIELWPHLHNETTKLVSQYPDSRIVHGIATAISEIGEYVPKLERDLLKMQRIKPDEEEESD